MRHTTVSLSDIAAAGFRLDPGYYLALARLKEHQESGVSLLDHLKATVPVEEAQAWLKRLPSADVVKRVAPLLTQGQSSGYSSTSIVSQVARDRPHEALALVVAALDDMKADAAKVTQAAQAQEATLDSLSQVRPSRRPHP